MRLRGKVVHIILGIIVLYAVIVYGIIHHLIYPGFVSLEDRNAARDADRCREAIRREIDHLGTLCQDWANWDAAWDFAVDRDPEFLRQHVPPTTFSGMAIDMMLIVDTTGAVVWGQVRDHTSDTLLHVLEIPTDSLGPDHPLLALPYAGKPLADVILGGSYVTAAGPMIISARPILNNMAEGPRHGVFVIGRFLTADYLRTLVEQTRVDFKWWVVTDTGMPADARAALMTMPADSDIYVIPHDDQTLESYVTFVDIQHRPSMLIRADIPRTITAEGRATTGFALISALIAGVVVLTVLLLILQKLIVNPLAALTQLVVRIRTSADLTQRIKPTSTDEIGMLGREFDRMLAELATARNRMAEQAFHLGRAEIAAGGLHYVRNSLTPIVGQIDDMSLETAQIPADNLEQAVSELSTEATPEDRRAALTQFVCSTAESMVPYVREMARRTDSLSESIQRLEATLSRWEAISEADRVTEPFLLTQVVNEVINALSQDTKGAAAIVVGRFDHVPALMGEPYALAHVIFVALNRAAEAIRSADHRIAGRIDISGKVEEIEGSTYGHLIIADNGPGLSEHTLQHAFDREVEEPGEASEGHNLHWAANTLTAMGGRMWIASAGKNEGTEAHICVPLASEAGAISGGDSHTDTGAWQ